MTLPGIVGGSIIVFIPSLGNFIVPSLLGGAKVVMTGNLIEQQFLSARNWPFGAALGMMVMAAVLILLLVYVRLLSREERRSFERESGRGGRRRDAHGCGWPGLLLSAYGWLFLIFIYAPILLIAVFSFNSNPINMMIWAGASPSTGIARSSASRPG